MSKQTITKEVEAVVCEFCNEEINTKDGNYCYHHLRSTDGDVIKGYQYGVKHILFSWYHRKAPPSIEYVQYDFHASCFDELMQKFLDERGKDEI
ncbi:hypothetical protein ACWFRF_15610 [Nocardia sp. NPDC055165]